MLQQKLRNRQPTALQGLGLVALVALAAVAGSGFFSRLAPRLGPLSSVLFIAYGCAIAWFLLDWYALTFVYTATDDCLRICRAYGQRERYATDVWFNQVVAWGEPEAMKRRYPSAPTLRATRAQCEYPPLALVYNSSGKTAVAVLQPDPQLRKHIEARLKQR